MSGRQRRGGGERSGLILAGAMAIIFTGLILYYTTTGGAAPSNAIANAEPPPDITDIMSESGEGMTLELTDKQDPTRLAGMLKAESYEPQGPNERLVTQPRFWYYLRDGRTLHVQSDRGYFLMPPGAAGQPPESGQLIGDVLIRMYEELDGQRQPIPGLDEPMLTATLDEPLEFDMRNARLATVGRVHVETNRLEMAAEHVTAYLNQVQERLELLEARRGESITLTSAPPPPPEESPAPASEVQTDPIASQIPPNTATSAASPPAPSPASEPEAGASAEAIANAPETSDSDSSRNSAPIAASDEAAPAQDPATTTAAAPEPKIDEYELVFLDGVSITRQTQRARGDKLEVWVRLIDQQTPALTSTPAPQTTSIPQSEVPEDIAAQVPYQLRSTSLQTQPDPRPEPDGSSEPDTTDPASFDAVQPDPASTPSIGPETETGEHNADPAVPAIDKDDTLASAEDTDPPIVLRWSGPLTVRPADTTPEPLTASDLAYRLTAEKTGVVRIDDSAQGLDGEMVAIDGRADVKDINLYGRERSVNVVWDGQGRFEGTRATINTATGDVHARGPSVFYSRPGAVNPATGAIEYAQRIRSTEQADFKFAVVDGSMTSDIETASFYGDVEAIDGSSSVERANALHATFAPPPPGRTDRMITRAVIEGGRALDGRGRSAEGRSMRVDFAPGTMGEDVDPVLFLASGSVRLEDNGMVLHAEELDSELVREDDGGVGVGNFAAFGDVSYRHPDGTHADADRMRGRGRDERVRFFGAPATVGKSGVRVIGPDVLVDGGRSLLLVEGPGTAEKDESVGADGTLTGLGWATWTTSMRYDDAAGRITCVGDVRMETRPDARTRDMVIADRVELELTPLDEAASVGGERTIRHATAFGRPAPLEAQARAETRIYLDETLEVVERMHILQGAELRFDGVADTIHVPSGGQMLALDRRPNQANPLLRPEAPLMVGGRGHSLFEWGGEMTYDRAKATAELRRQVRVIHQDLGQGRNGSSGEITELETERLRAEFGAVGEGADSPVGAGELIRARADGAAFLKNAQGEMVADHLDYDARNGTVTATADPGGVVTYVDPTSPTPVSAGSLFWDLIRDRIVIDRPSPSDFGSP